jgi:hypothetical protein
MALIRELVDPDPPAFHVDFSRFLWKGRDLSQLQSLDTYDVAPVTVAATPDVSSADDSLTTRKLREALVVCPTIALILLN